MNGPKGRTLIIHQGQPVYFGPFASGVFSDNNTHLRLPVEERTGWGIKVDIFKALTVRPVPCFWEREAWIAEDKKTKIWDIINDAPKAIAFFGGKVYSILKMKQGTETDPKKVHDFKFSITNCWKGKFWFLFRLPYWLPLVFVSISTPWKSGYIGFKTYKCEPFFNGFHSWEEHGDITWTTRKEKVYCGSDPYFRAACPSITIRKNRR